MRKPNAEKKNMFINDICVYWDCVKRERGKTYERSEAGNAV